ncbi:MAG: acyl carrier protein [Candidatus Omnitrophica bacterium]|nr:acyl carrier protein [Candidatus Omnitrophota bacterium]MDD5430409.1 acyl carrier protein [Candidatus Omnitrophota bacterium]
MSENAFEGLGKEIQQLIAEVTGKSMEDLRPEANFWEDLGIDSIKAIEITVAIERKYKIRIGDEQIPQIMTVGKAVEVVRQALEKKKNA